MIDAVMLLVDLVAMLVLLRWSLLQSRHEAEFGRSETGSGHKPGRRKGYTGSSEP